MLPGVKQLLLTISSYGGPDFLLKEIEPYARQYHVKNVDILKMTPQERITFMDAHPLVYEKSEDRRLIKKRGGEKKRGKV